MCSKRLFLKPTLFSKNNVQPMTMLSHNSNPKMMASTALQNGACHGHKNVFHNIKCVLQCNMQIRLKMSNEFDNVGLSKHILQIVTW